MSRPQYYSYPGHGVQSRQTYHYNQAVRIPAGADRVELAGQGGWDPETSLVHSDLFAQIDQAFSNVQLVLHDAGVKEGWKNVFRVTTYHTGLAGDEERILLKVVENLKKWCTGHPPLWTCVGVAALGLPEMSVEVEVAAFDEKK